MIINFRIFKLDMYVKNKEIDVLLKIFFLLLVGGLDYRREDVGDFLMEANGCLEMSDC